MKADFLSDELMKASLSVKVCKDLFFLQYIWESNKKNGTRIQDAVGYDYPA